MDEINAYNDEQSGDNRDISELLNLEIRKNLPMASCKIWHGHPVWFDAGNPLVGYAVRKESVQLLFWSGQSFDEPGLEVEGSFKAAQVQYKNVNEVNVEDLARWLKKAQEIQWDYKNIVKRRGQLERST